jgi:hypothetical protein
MHRLGDAAIQNTGLNPDYRPCNAHGRSPTQMQRKLTKLALCDSLHSVAIAVSYAGLENNDQGNPRGQLYEESLRMLVLTEVKPSDKRNLHMIPADVIYGWAIGGGDCPPEYPLETSGAILPLFAQISTRVRGEGQGEDDQNFTDLVKDFETGEPTASLIEFSDYQIEQQGWTITHVLDTDDETRRTIAQGPWTVESQSLWLVELVLLAGNLRETNIDGRPEDRICPFLHIICDDTGRTYDHSSCLER